MIKCCPSVSSYYLMVCVSQPISLSNLEIYLSLNLDCNHVNNTHIFIFTLLSYTDLCSKALRTSVLSNVQMQSPNSLAQVKFYCLLPSKNTSLLFYIVRLLGKWRMIATFSFQITSTEVPLNINISSNIRRSKEIIQCWLKCIFFPSFLSSSFLSFFLFLYINLV